ncbi:cation:proton antiporter [Burkholderia sp. NRF60-BP8]|uniref:cation:proton antiporter n=1 Tax=Burkholderia sp. NRF60-BP8 TaxID=1637853 RepID=UPI00075F24F3|nr:cation:proton antiporter [Burkholderia sp. NRF60-BP8]AOI76843.1 hypothetical protein WS54_11490 [Burkholderia sp. NRF60-BP8]KVA16321.1 hypothetical protein WS54_08275 [Burkholderia sp. NRF60-BP8]
MWLIQFVVIVAACRLCGMIAVRVGQCEVIGEIAAGLLLSPSILGAFAPGLHAALFGAGTAATLAGFSELGLLLLMFETGMHLQLPHGRPRAMLALPGMVALLGFAMPFLAGIGVALWIAPLSPPASSAMPYALFCGIALAVSAVPVLARIIRDLALDSHLAARTAMTAALLTDMAGWSALIVVAGMAHVGNGIGWAGQLLAFSGYAVACVIVARAAVLPFARKLSTARQTRALLTLSLCCIALSSWATDRLGFHAAIGALLPGLLLRSVPDLREHWQRTIGEFGHLALVPLFFSYAGTQTSISFAAGTALWLPFCCFFIAGFVGKFGGAYLGARLGGLASNDAAIVGILMNTRGLMELIVLSVGRQLGILPPSVYAMFVVFALLTTAMTAPVVRFATRNHARIATRASGSGA